MSRRLGFGRTRCVGALTLFVVCAALAPAAEGRGLAIGLTDPVVYEAPAPVRDLWLDRTVAAGASIVRIDALWSGIAPRNRPAGFNASDPGDPAYHFAGLDARIRAARVRGLQVMLTFSGAPDWAEGPGRAADAPPGTWRPDLAAVGQFAEALARRYSGAYPDPAALGAMLPAVAYFQVWNEPNLAANLTPQWVSQGGGFIAAAPAHYRLMLNAAYDAIKRANPGALVVTGGTAPFGDLDGGGRMQPARFVRELLCISADLRPLPCPDPARFDVLDHHPYSFGGPRTRANGPDEVSVPDFGKLLQPLRAAERTGLALPRARKRVWVSEIAWDSSPPDPLGVPSSTHARWVEDAFYILWKQEVDTIFWFQARDELPNPSYAQTNQGGLYLYDGTPKLALRAFRFPFVTRRLSRKVVRIWGKAPAPGSVRVQRFSRGRWVTIARLNAVGERLFEKKLRLRGRATLRAASGALTSLSWSQKA